MKALFYIARAYPASYFAACCLLGLTIRLGMAHGDLGLFFNPLFPLFTH